MILYTEQQFEAVYNIDRKERMRLGIPTTTMQQYRIIFEAILDSLYEEYDE
jgi:hypothetical protein|tara:strand:+ start:66 stop:218 length:153 start_codon:yes stop_codon:yes gene_type:complete